MLASFDGYVADEHGGFDWAEPDEEVHVLVYDLEERRFDNGFLYLGHHVRT